MIRIFIGNLAHAADERAIITWIKNIAGLEVSTAQVIRDRVSGHSRGFAFVEVPGDARDDDDQVKKICQSMNGLKMMGRALTVNAAFPKTGGQR